MQEIRTNGNCKELSSISRNDENNNGSDPPAKRLELRKALDESSANGSDTTPEEAAEKESGIFGASLNLTKTIVGSGIISLPVAIKQSGFLCGIVLLVLMALITDYSIYILVSVGARTGKLSCQEAAQEAFGTPGAVVMSAMQATGPLIGGIHLLIIAGRVMSAVVSGLFLVVGEPPPGVLVNEMFLKAVIILFVALPLSMIRNIARLEKISGLGILFVLCLEAIVVYEMVTMYCPVRCYDFSIHNSTLLPPPQPCCQSTISSWFVNYQLFSAMGIFAAAYACQFNIFLIYNSLNKRTVRRFMISTNISVWTAFSLFTVLGGVGYLTFMNSTRGDLLTNYCADDVVAAGARIAYAVNVMVGYPFNIFITREVLERSLQHFPRKCYETFTETWKKKVGSFLYSPLRHSLPRHCFLTFCLVGLSAAVALPVSNLGDFVNFVGSFTSIPLIFIIPSVLHLKLVKDKGAVAMVMRILNIILIILGIGLIVLGTGMGIYQMVVDTTPVQTHLLYCGQNQAVIGTCPIEGFRNFSSPRVSSFWGCACEDVFTADHPHLCHNTSESVGYRD